MRGGRAGDAAPLGAPVLINISVHRLDNELTRTVGARVDCYGTQQSILSNPFGELLLGRLRAGESLGDDALGLNAVGLKVEHRYGRVGLECLSPGLGQRVGRGARRRNVDHHNSAHGRVGGKRTDDGELVVERCARPQDASRRDVGGAPLEVLVRRAG
eukprot:scaffold78982_cov26-Tisochrysis_lutea.AAC.2